jgi:hypothetical protein
MAIGPDTPEQTGAMLTQPNVRINKKFESVEQPKRKINKYLHDTLFPLVLAKPNWIFTITDHGVWKTEAIATKVTISEGGEMLGSIGVEYCRSGYKLVVKNERIDAKRERGSGYRTESSEKALLAIRKHFYRLGTSERLDKVRDEAEAVLGRARSNISWDVNRRRAELMEDSEEFTKAHMEQYLAEFPSRAQYKDKYYEIMEVCMIIDNVKDLFDKGEALVVVLESDRYIVVQGKGEPQTYTNDTLPYYMREKIGMLKLVEDHQMVRDVGCRVKADAFVITPEVKEQ